MEIKREISIQDGKYFASVNVCSDKNKTRICFGQREDGTSEWFVIDAPVEEAVLFVSSMTKLLNEVLNEIK